MPHSTHQSSFPTSPTSPTPPPQKAPSQFLLFWLQADSLHGYEFSTDVLFGHSPDTDWLDGHINQPNSWAEVAKCLEAEIDGQRRLSRSHFRSHVNVWYWRGCISALKEVEEFCV